MSQPARHNLLPLPRPYVGPGNTVTALAAAITDHRVVQLTGPAGSGKTEMARAVGHHFREAGAYTDGILHLSMAGATTPASMQGELTFQFGHDELAPVGQSLGTWNMLVIWDQMDRFMAHGWDEGRKYLMETLADAPNIRHLIVVRETLEDLPEVPIDPLPTDAAFTLFCAHIPASVSSRPTPDDTPMVESLERLGGNPLAIQLAAAWCRPPRTMERLAHALTTDADTTDADTTDGLGRMLDLAAHDLNPETTRLERLIAGFPGGATGEFLAATFGERWSDFYPTLQQTGRSITVADRHELPPAVVDHIHRTVSARDKEVFEEQAAVFLQQMVKECRAQLEVGNPSTPMRFMNHEWVNLRAVFCWVVARMSAGTSIDLEEDCGLAMDFCFTMFHLFTHRRMIVEGLEWMRAGTRASESLDKPHDRALLQDYCGILLALQGRRDEARVELTEALTAFRTLAEPLGIASAGYHLALLAYETGDHEAAYELFDEASPYLRGGRNRAYAAQAHTYLGLLELERGNPQAAMDALTEAQDMYEEAQLHAQQVPLSVDLKFQSWLGLARAHRELGAHDDGLTTLRDALEWAFSISPRLAMTSVPALLEAAHSLLGTGQSAHLEALAREVGDMVTELEQTQVAPEQANEWRMGTQIMGRIGDLLRQLPAAFGPNGDTPIDPSGTAASDTDAARARALDVAQELDAMTGNMMQVSAWVQGHLAAQTPPSPPA